MYNITQENQRVDCFLHRKYVSNYTQHENFRALVEVVEIYGGAYGKEPGLIKEELKALIVNYIDAADDDTIAIEEDVVHNLILVLMILSGANNGIYVVLKYDLSNHYTMGTINYSINMEKYICLLYNYKSAKKNHISNLVT